MIYGKKTKEENPPFREVIITTGKGEKPKVFYDSAGEEDILQQRITGNSRSALLEVAKFIISLVIGVIIGYAMFAPHGGAM